MFPSIFSKQRKQLFLFDMDGICAEHNLGEGEKAKNNAENYYINKRPIKSVIKQAKKHNCWNFKQLQLFKPKRAKTFVA